MRLFISLLLLSYVTLYPLCILRNTVSFAQQGKDWNGLCRAGKRQSPLNLENNILNLPKNIINIQYSSAKGNVKWNGNFFRLDVEGNENKVTFTDFYSGKTQDYFLKRIIIKTPSEHKLNGKHYESEIQFINLAENCSFKNDLTIFSVFIQKSNKKKKQHEFISGFNLNGASSISNLQQLFDDQKSYYFYEGSQTIPDCRENVNWFIFDSPINATASYLTNLQKNFCHKHPFGNARLTQNLNGRNVFRFQKKGK